MNLVHGGGNWDVYLICSCSTGGNVNLTTFFFFNLKKKELHIIPAGKWRSMFLFYHPFRSFFKFC